MKTRLYTYFLIGVFSLSFANSCTKSDEIEPGGSKIVLRASQEIPANIKPSSKTYFKTQLTSIWWTAGDRVTVLPSDGDGYTSNSVESAAATFDFTVSGWPAGVTPKYAVFNGPQNNVATVSNDVITTTLSDNQEIYHKNSFSKKANLSVGEIVLNGSEYTSTMMNVCALVRFSIEKYDDIVSVKVEDANSSAALAGTCAIEMEDGKPVVKSVSDSKTSVTASYSSDYFPKGSNYYICVLPCTFKPKFTLTREDGSTIVITGKSNITLSRAVSQDFGTIDNVSSHLVLQSAHYTNSETSGRSLVEGLATGNAGSSNPFTIQMSNGNKYTFTPQGINLRLITSADAGDGNTGVIAYVNGGFLQLPSVDGYTLSSVTVTFAATNKRMALTTSSASDPSSTTSITMSETKTLNASGSSSDTYYLYFSTGSRIGTLILTYTEN